MRRGEVAQKSVTAVVQKTFFRLDGDFRSEEKRVALGIGTKIVHSAICNPDLRLNRAMV